MVELYRQLSMIKKGKKLSKNAQILKRIYYDFKKPGALGGIDKFYQNVKRRNKNITRNQVKQWLQGEEAYTLHKPVRRKFKRNKVYVSFIDQQFEADLVDMSHLKKENTGYTFLLTCIDVLSKYAWAIPLKSKSAADVAQGFESILKTSGRICQRLHTDEGKEFYNTKFKALLKSYNIEHFSSGNKDIKCSVIERFNRTLKTKMYRYFTAKSTNAYIKILPQLLISYNASKHRSIGMAPEEVNLKNQKQVWEKLYGGGYPSSKKFKLSIGDQVRVSRIKGKFEQGYLQNWSDEVFVVIQRIARSPPVYKLRDADGENVQGVFYFEELQSVYQPKDAYFKVEKILETKKEKGKTLYLVKYKGYPAKFNAWIAASNLKKL